MCCRINNIIRFLIIKFINKLSKLGHKKEKTEEVKQETELSILKEIRDELKLNKQVKTRKKKADSKNN